MSLDERTTRGEAAADGGFAMFGTMPSMVARCDARRSNARDRAEQAHV